MVMSGMWQEISHIKLQSYHGHFLWLLFGWSPMKNMVTFDVLLICTLDMSLLFVMTNYELVNLISSLHCLGIMPSC